jgi:FO synthase subunit 1
MFTGADEYGVDLTIDDADVERLLAVTPDDADPPASLSL